MILVDVLIENYKQYAGSRRIAIPAEATVGIIGANGVGKTTLFEAIEWCLYNPRSIANDEVRPRGQASHTRVAVTMDRPETGERFVVERQLKRAGVTAGVYRIDEDGTETPVVQGTNQVTDYVSTRLIGLGHGAFVSTFFTRQKELSFFGHLRDTDRRREVGRLLGLETIRKAQVMIGDERNQARAEAEHLRRQYEDQAQGRDFPAELEQSAACIAARERELAVAGQELDRATERLREETARRNRWQALKDDDSSLHRDLVQIETKLHGREERLTLRTADLSRLAEREMELARLRPIAANEPALVEQLRDHDARYEKYQQQRQHRRDLERLAETHKGHVHEISQHVLSITLTEPVDGWTWRDADAAAPLDAVARLQAAIGALDLAGAESRAELLDRCQEAAKEHQEASDTYALYLKRRQEIDTERQELLEAGDPRDALRELDERRQQAQIDLSDANARAATLQTERDQTVDLLTNLRQAKFGDVCPTCARPFSAAEEGIVVASLTDRRDELDRRIAAGRGEARAARACLQRLQADRQREEARSASLQHVLGRLAASEPYVLEARTKLGEAERKLEMALRGAGRATPPPVDEVARAAARAALFRDLTKKAADLTTLERSLRRANDEQAQASAALAALGEVVYDAHLHQRTADELRRARDASVAVAEIERELSRRPAIEQDLEQCRAEIDKLTEERNEVSRKREALGFDAAALAQAITDEEVAHAAERAARDARHEALAAHREAVQRHDALRQEQARIAALATRADTRRREADQLDVMVHEFTAFDQYVAGRYGPILAETTSELVGQVTEGKYDRVEYDENYGIEVYDGTEEKFPLETFSGGERDAIALCARLALSRMVGSQAVSPPGFLVLDEVFGSLDRDRRARLLELLGSLAGATESFHQLFVISHVDDVQHAVVFDEVWRVAETGEGVSQIENVSEGAGLVGDS